MTTRTDSGRVVANPVNRRSIAAPANISDPQTNRPAFALRASARQARRLADRRRRPTADPPTSPPRLLRYAVCSHALGGFSAILLIGLVLLPFLLFEQQFNAFAEHVTRDGTSKWLVASAVFALLALDVFLPVPSSIVSTASGVLLGFGLGSAVVWTGMMAGCLVGYATSEPDAWEPRGGSSAMTGSGAPRRSCSATATWRSCCAGRCRSSPKPASCSPASFGRVQVRFVHLTAVSNLGIAAGYAAVRRLLAPPGFVFVPDCVRWCLASSRAFHLRVAQDVWTPRRIEPETATGLVNSLGTGNCKLITDIPLP